MTNTTLKMTDKRIYFSKTKTFQMGVCLLINLFRSARVYPLILLVLLSLGVNVAQAQETVCARVKIEIKQELTLERQAFDAEMKINNTTDTGVIENVGVEVKVTDESGSPIAVSSNPNDLSAKFFVRLSNKQNIAAVDGTGVVNPKTTSVINWLLIPAPGAAGSNAFGKKYLVGATLRYKFGGEETTLDVSPDVITVKPLPLLTLDYFLTQDVVADDPLTDAIEATEPFTLGVRVKNNGYAVAKNLKIDSAQPKIIENNQGLLINFLLTGSYVNDAPVANTLLINFGDIAPNTSKMGRWNMETTLAGKFTEFTAKFSHADELGGALTSILQATNAHFLIRDVKVDLPGRDQVRDFLANDGDVIRVYESDGPDTLVTDRSGVATLTPSASVGGNAGFQLTFPATAGFSYVKLPDPFRGSKALGKITRSDAKELLADNVWLSKTRNEQTKQWEYWVNFFDVNSTGSYTTEFQTPTPAATPPALQFIPDRVVKEEQQVSFLVEGSTQDGRPIELMAAPLPAGATFTQQTQDAASGGVRRAVFDWTPAKGSAGNYLITYTVTDGVLSSSRSASIKVNASTPPPGPGTPTLMSPLAGAQVVSLKPTLSVQASTLAQDPTKQVQFEVYADEAETQLVASGTVPKAADGAGNGAGSVAAPTTWQLPADLSDNTKYWWRARAYDGALYSAWVNGRFFVNTFNDAPDNFNLSNPVPNAEVTSVTPQLTWTNSLDKDGDAIVYQVSVYKDAAMTELVAEGRDIAPDASGSTSWTVTSALMNHVKYYWRVTAKDALGAQTLTVARPFMVNTGNAAPTAPTVLRPAVGGQSNTATTVLEIQNSTDADNDTLSYVFEVDTVNTFDSADKRSSGAVASTNATSTQWQVTSLVENKHYWWRVKAQDGHAESAWVIADFLMNAVNDAPGVPTVKNPGNGSWTSTQQPSLEANPVLDPEGEAVRYQFEVYKDPAMTSLVTEGVSTNTSWIVPTSLLDKTTHWWRVRALDAQNAYSEWSVPAVLYVSTAPYQDPTIALTSPATPVQPEKVSSAQGTKQRVTLRWEGTDPNIEPTVALYWSPSKTGYAGNLIVDGLKQQAGVQSGTYDWDVTNLPAGTYYVYAVIYDAKGVGKSYAPGAVVIAPERQSGSIVVKAGSYLLTSEDGKTAAFSVRLGQAPTSDVLVPLVSSASREGDVTPKSLTFTPQNWATAQTVTVTGQNDCAPDGNQRYQVLSGKAQTLDPNFIGLSGNPVNLVNLDNADFRSTTNSPYFHICGLTKVAERRVSGRVWEYALRSYLTNTGSPVRGVGAQLVQAPYGIEIVKSTLVFGAVNTGESTKTNDVIVLRSRFAIPDTVLRLGIGFRWNVMAAP